MDEETFRQSVRQEGDCLIWTRASGAMSKYPQYRYGYVQWDGKLRIAHRVAFLLEHGRWPNDVVHHACRNTLCVNPAHLVEMDRSDHTYLHVGGSSTHCTRGHEYTEENKIYRKDGRRICRECARARTRRYMRRKRNSDPSKFKYP